MRVIGDDTKAGVGGVLLHDAAERHLGGGRHGVRLIEDYEFVAAEGLKVSRFWWRREDLFCACRGELRQ